MRTMPAIALCAALAGCGGAPGGGQTVSVDLDTMNVAAVLDRYRPKPSPGPPLPLDELLRDSHDFSAHRAVFVRATRQLLDGGRCIQADFQAQGGWMKSTIEHPDEPVYFIYCGGGLIENRIFLNVRTGKLLS